jgi:hypothetical protein
MKTNLKLLKASISNIAEMVKSLSNEQLNEIPVGYSNNIIWNVAHLVVTQKLLIYDLSNNELNLDDNFLATYRKGGKPNGIVGEEECKSIILLFEYLYTELEQDLEGLDFSKFKVYQTSYNFEITNLEEAITFNNLHFGLHFAFLLKLKKSIAKS